MCLQIQLARSGTPSHSQAPQVSNQFIVLPNTLQKLPQAVRITPHSTAEAATSPGGYFTTAVLSPVSPVVAQKYKKIQPKPGVGPAAGRQPPNRSCSAVESFFSLSQFDDQDAATKRRHSVSVPFAVAAQLSAKRQLEGVSDAVTKKRLISGPDDMPTAVPLDPSGGLNTSPVFANNVTTHNGSNGGSIVDDGDVLSSGSASLSSDTSDKLLAGTTIDQYASQMVQVVTITVLLSS